MIEAQIFLPFEGYLDLLGIGARLEHEVVFEIAVIAIKNNIDSWINVRDSHTAVVRDAAERVSAVGADEVIAYATGGIETGNVAPGPAAGQSHLESAGRAGCALAKHHDNRIVGDLKLIARTMRGPRCLRLSLAPV